MDNSHPASDSVGCVPHKPSVFAIYGQKRPGRCHKAGVSLVEIVVVLAILMVLAALIAPTIASSKLQARRAEVKSALRQADLQLELYAADYDQASRRIYPPVDHWILNLRPQLPQQSWSNSPQKYVYYPRFKSEVPEGYTGQTAFQAWEKALELSDGRGVAVIANFSLTLNCAPNEFIDSCLWDGIAITDQHQLIDRKSTGNHASPLWWTR